MLSSKLNPRALCLRRLIHTKAMSKATNTAKATMPAAIPPFAPLERLFESVEAAAVLVDVVDGVEVGEVEDAVNIDR